MALLNIVDNFKYLYISQIGGLTLGFSFSKLPIDLPVKIFL